MSLTMHDRAHIFFSRRVFFSVGHCSLSRVVSFVAKAKLQTFVAWLGPANVTIATT